MYDNYKIKVPRDVFEEEVLLHSAPIFSPEGPIITSNEIYFTYRRGQRRVCITASVGENDYILSEKPYMERQIMATFNRMVKYPKYNLDDLPKGFDIKQLMFSHPKYDGKMLPFAVFYDLNSSFNYAELLGVIPDTDREYTGNIKKGDVGIRLYKDKWIFATSGHGFKCFPLISWNVKKFIDIYYKRKKEATTPEEKQKAKDFLTHHVGSMKYHNQIIRCWIIWNQNKNIEKYKDENTILMNTDSIISLKERTDLPLGTDIGQFDPAKIIKGRFAKRNMDYQFYDSDLIKKRGLDRSKREGFDIIGEAPKGKRTAPVIPSSTGYNFIRGKFKK